MLLQLALAAALSFVPPDVADDLCVPRAQISELAACEPVGPGAYQAQYAAAHIPAQVAELLTEKLPRPAKVLEQSYARVITADAPLFTSAEEAQAGVAADSLGKGFVFVQTLGTVQAGEQVLYQTRSGKFIRAADVQPVEPSRWQGLKLTAKPERTFGWLVKSVRPSALPGIPAPTSLKRLARGTLIQIFGTVRVGAWNWYLVGNSQWVEQRAVSVVSFLAPPEGVTGNWVQVDLYEQTLVAYEGAQPVYATLVSSGLEKWATEPGLFQVWARLKDDQMQGAYEPDGSDYYSLEAVPYVMYFDGDRALHGQYWHDALGYKRSHGCVNLSPLDARWVYEWSALGTYVWVFDPSQPEARTEAVAEGP